MNHRSFYLQTLYLQKPLLLIVFIAILSTLPWLGLGDFYTKGEPREASLALSMINDGNWILPFGYADEIAYKPPLSHWLITGFSYLINGGEVTPFTARIPSALAFVALIWICFMFFARRRSTLEAFLACLIIITSFEIHRAAMTTRIDMLLTFLIVASIIQLFVWDEKGKKRYLVSSWFFLSLATLVKGPVGIVLPCLIIGAYLLLSKTNRSEKIKKILIIALLAVLSFIIPAIWYCLAYRAQGQDFINLVFAENFGRFFSIGDGALNIKYKLGVENPWWYYPPSLLAGFLPWTLLVIISLFFIKYTMPSRPVKQIITEWWDRLRTNKIHLLGFLVIVLTILFFSIPSSKRTVYIMAVYPFLALFLAQFFLFLVQHKPKPIRIYAVIMLSLVCIVLLIAALTFGIIIDLGEIGEMVSKREATHHDFKMFGELFRSPTVLGVVIMVFMLFVVVYAINALRRQSNLKVLMVSVALMYSVNLFLDGFVLPRLKNSYSSKPFAEYISNKYDLKGNVYVINDLTRFANMYGLNFYMGNNFKNFDKEKPERGYFIAGSVSMEKIRETYPGYTFTELEVSTRYNDYKSPMVLCSIIRNSMQPE